MGPLLMESPRLWGSMSHLKVLMSLIAANQLPGAWGNISGKDAEFRQNSPTIHGDPSPGLEDDACIPVTAQSRLGAHDSHIRRT